jgi:hypothetical protein
MGQFLEVTAQGRELWTAVRPYQSVQADTVVGFEKRIKQRNEFWKFSRSAGQFTEIGFRRDHENSAGGSRCTPSA